MSRTTGPIEFTQLLIFLTIEPLPLSVDIGGFFWQRETYNPNSPVYTELALDELVESVSGSIGISLDAGAASAITVWVNSVPIGDVEPGETLELPFVDVPVSVVVTPFVDLFDFRVTRIGEFTGELLGECPFTLNSLTVDFTVADDEEPPVGECFWTDLVNATQECGGAPDPEPPESPHLTFVVQGSGTSLTITRLPAGSVVHWGDGDVYVAPSLSGSVAHNYFLEEGVTAQGHIEFPDDPVWDTYFNFSGTALAAIPSWGEKEIPPRVAFINCPNLTEVPTEGPPPGATSMNNMFGGAPNLTSDITGWDTSNITDMTETFAGNASFNQDISGWDTSSVTKMHRMFQYASSFNQPIGSWDVSNVTGMVQMFADASSFNQDLSGWCVSAFASEPSNFRTGSPLSNENCPVWGTCP